MKQRLRWFLVAASMGLLHGVISAPLQADWMQFRGPGGNGTSSATGLPEQWSQSSGIRWRAALPGLGTSSPIIVGARVFVTCYSGYAESTDSPGDMDKLKRHVVCLDRDTGKIVWQVAVEPKLPESRYEGGNNTWHGYSSSTPVSDGTHLYVFFGRTGVFCYDLAGKQIWHTNVGTGVKGWGSGASPVLYQDLVIVNASVESSALVALDKSTGQEKWRVRNLQGCWNTPLLVPLADGSTELVVSLPRKVLAVNPASGEELWNCIGIPDDGYVCPSAISEGGIVYLIGGRKNTAMAIKAGGRGDVTDTHVLWTTAAGSNVSSPVYHQGHLYWVHEKQGILLCLDAQSGKIKFQERLDPRPGIVYGSVVVADGKLYAVSQFDGVFVFAASPTYTLLAHNQLADDDSRSNASLAIDGSQLFLRNDKYLYCLGK